jgi:hypothetical protein
LVDLNPEQLGIVSIMKGGRGDCRDEKQLMRFKMVKQIWQLVRPDPKLCRRRVINFSSSARWLQES